MGIFIVQGAAAGVIGTLAGVALRPARSRSTSTSSCRPSSALLQRQLPAEQRLPDQPHAERSAERPTSCRSSLISLRARVRRDALPELAREPRAARPRRCAMSERRRAARSLRARPAQALHRRQRRRARRRTCCAASTSTVQRGETLADRRRVGLGQEHAAAPARRARCADARARVELAGRDFAALDAGASRASWRNRHLGFVYQFHHLLPEFTRARQRRDAAAHPPRRRRARRASARAAMLAQVGLAERAAAPAGAAVGRRAPARRDRARAGRRSPACVLADEPTGNLDRDTADGVFALMLDLARRARHGVRAGHARRAPRRALRPGAAARCRAPVGLESAPAGSTSTRCARSPLAG